VSLRSPLGRVLGLGSARDGTSHWWAERLSSVALVPLTLWFLFSLLLLPSLDFTVLRTWLAVPMSGFLTLLLVVVLTYHAYLGSVVIVEDYVHEHGPKLTLMMSLRFLFVLCGGASLFAILRIAFGS
jgi:succinate dehydrogenase / fumarate reductase membrane anchor subunit